MNTRSGHAALCGALLLAAVLAPSSVSGQAVFPDANGQTLKGVLAVDAHALPVTWLNVELDRSTFEGNVQAAFELGLRRDGVRVESAAPNYLLCELSVAQNRGLIAYSWQLSYYGFASKGVHPLLWEASGIVTVGVDNFDGDAATEECVDRFAREWLRWNPRQDLKDNQHSDSAGS